MTAPFGLLQTTGNVTGTGSLAFTVAATTAKSGLVATVVAPTTTPSTPPTADWRLAARVLAPAAAGMIETWLYRPSGSTINNPGGATSFTFAGAAGVAYRGSLTEWMPPGGTDMILHCAGRASGASGTSFPVTTSAGNVAGVLGWAVAADFFNANVPAGNTWGGLPAGWTSAQNIASGPPFVYRTAYHANLPAANSTSMTPTFGYTTGQTGWCVSVVEFRARVFRNEGLDGAEVSNLFALSGDSQVMLMLGDVMGIGRTVSPNLGDQWEHAGQGVWQDHWGQVACGAWSPLAAGGGDPAGTTVYAGVGRNNDGGFLASTDGGATWVMRSTAVQFVGNNARAPLPTSFNVRSTGNLIAFDTTNNLIYVATYNGGIARSADRGVTWTYIGLADGTWYPRTLVINPDNVNELWVGCYDYDGTNARGGVWHCTTASTAVAATGQGPFTQDTTAPPIVEELRVVGAAAARYLYAACGLAGIYRFQVGAAGWTHLANAIIDDTSTTNGGSLWISVDGYVDGTGKHQIIAACGTGIKQGANAHYTNVVKIADAIGTPAYSDLTGTAVITTATIPPDGRAFWKGSGWYGHLGNSGFTIPHVLIDPNDAARQTIYVSGYGGVYRTYDGGAHWDMPVNGLNMSKFNHGAIDPLDPNHVVYAGSDTEQSDLRDLTGRDTTKWFNAPFPQVQAESHGVAFDPKDGRIVGITNTKYGEKTGGGVFWRAPAATVGGASSKTWNDMGWKTTGPTGDPAVIGVYAGRDGAGGRFVCVVAQGAGMWRWAGGTTWTQVNTAAGTSGQTAQVCPFVPGNNPAFIYCYDRGKGIWRSTDYGLTWALAWAKPAANIRSGWLAVNPAVPGELWVAADDGLYKLTGAGAGTVENGAITKTAITGFANGAGGLAFGPGGNVYCVQLASAGATNNLLLTSSDGGAHWSDVCGGDGSFSSYARLPAQLLITSTGTILCTTDTNQAVFGTIPSTTANVPSITTTSLPAGTLTVAYPSTALGVSGGTGPFTWSVTAGVLPPGLALSAAGVITGTPTTAGLYSFTVQVTDANANTDTQVLSIAVASAVSITTTSPLPGGTVGAAYSQALAATGGAGAPYTWTLTGGALPSGLVLSAAGAVAGTPAATGTATFTATATDSAGRQASGSFSLTVTAGPVVITTGALGPATMGVPYQAVFVAAGGTPPYGWSVTAGTLPPGLALSAAGVITGMATKAGPYTFTVQVTDAALATASGSFTITVYAPAPGPPPAPARWKILYGPPQPAGGQADEVLQAQNKVITLRCQPGQISEVGFDIDGRNPVAAGIQPPLLTDFQVMYGSRIVLVTRMGATTDQLDAGAHRLAVASACYREVLRRQPLETGDTVTWTGIDQATIAWNLIQAAQGHAGGNFGIVRGLGQSTGITRNYTANLGDYAADDIDALAQMTSGFEWAIEPVSPTGTSGLALNIYYPNAGADNGVVLAYGDDRISSIIRTVDPSTYANAVRVTGASGMTADEFDADGIPPGGRFGTVIGTQLKPQQALDDFATQALAQAQVLIPSYTVVFKPGAWGGPGDLWIGDTVTMQIASGYLAVNDRLRVVELSFAIGPDGNEVLTAQIGQIPFRPDKKIPAMLRRLRYLETR